MKTDLVMWTFNGSRTLDVVLRRINQVIPKETINQRLIVDDGSIDDTVHFISRHMQRIPRPCKPRS